MTLRRRDEERTLVVISSVSVSVPEEIHPLLAAYEERYLSVRSLIPDPSRAVIMPFVTTALEARLAVELGIPVRTPPDLAALGTKTGSRAVFAAAGVSHPRGRSGVRTVGDLVDALEELSVHDPPDEAVAQLDDGVGGFGNAIFDLTSADGRADLEARVRSLRPVDQALDSAGFLARLEEDGESSRNPVRVGDLARRDQPAQRRNHAPGPDAAGAHRGRLRRGSGPLPRRRHHQVLRRQRPP